MKKLLSFVSRWTASTNSFYFSNLSFSLLKYVTHLVLSSKYVYMYPVCPVYCIGLSSSSSISNVCFPWFYTFIFLKKASFCLFCLFLETGSHSVVQVDLEHVVLLLHPLECWDYRCASSSPATLKQISYCNDWLPSLKTDIHIHIPQLF